MRDVLGPGTILGYCTNVHPGNSLEQIEQNLDRYAAAVKKRVSPDQPMGVGLWFSVDVINEIATRQVDDDVILKFREWLETRGLLPYTINGFPFADFHQPVVKHAVYQPDWSDPQRFVYTMNLITVLHRLLPEGAEGSISTLPIGWEGQVGDGWADHVLTVVEALADLEQETGRLIHLDIEPEPGCEVGDMTTLMTFLMVLENMGGLPRDLIRRHLRICHDICHSAVMFEKPTAILQMCRHTGFRIGKVQLSSAVRAPFAGHTSQAKKAMRAQLESFNEPRYLHQTTVGTNDGSRLKDFYEDLDLALKSRRVGGFEWRVHFHVPIHLESLGALSTTRQAINDFLSAIRPEDEIRHFEVETYAWNVLPEHLRVSDLAEGIAQEIMWTCQQFRTEK